MFGGDGADLVQGGDGEDLMYGGNGNDFRMEGGNGNDRMYGNAGNDHMDGGAHDDTLHGGIGNDLLRGGKGNDWLDGGSGDDLIVGGYGKDYLRGGAGWDRFEFYSVAESRPGAAKRDVILDFQKGSDKIDLSAIDANVWKHGNQAFVFQGHASHFSGLDGALIYTQHNYAGTARDITVVSVDVNGDYHADLEIELKGLVNLKASDFLL